MEAGTWSEFVEGWELGIYANPVLAGAVAGALLGFLGVYVVLRRMVFVSAVVTQGAGLGVALSFLAQLKLGWDIDPGYGAVATSLVFAALLVPDPARTGMTRETTLGLVYALGGGAAILVGSRIEVMAHDIHAILFGPAVVVSEVDLDRLVWVAVGVLSLHLWWFRGLTFASSDPIAARVQGLPVALLDLVLLLSIGISVGVAAHALGALPVFALSIMPATAALLLSRGHLLLTFAVAGALGAAAGVLGYLVAFLYGFPVGGSQTVVAVLLAAAALIARGAALGVRRLSSARYRGRG